MKKKLYVNDHGQVVIVEGDKHYPFTALCQSVFNLLYQTETMEEMKYGETHQYSTGLREIIYQ